MNHTTKFHRSMGIYLLLLVVLFVAWAAWFEIDQVARAQGQVIPQEKTQIIQVADGGVVKELKVNEGDAVKKGQILAVLESDRARAAVDEISNRIAGLHITQLRARAEATGSKPHFADYGKTHPDLVRAQQELYVQNQGALRQETRALSEQVALANKELELMEKLHARGDISYVELMRTQRGVVDAQQKLQTVQDKYKSDAHRELTKIEDEITSQRSKLQERQSVLDHTDIQAPLEGVVKSLRITTLGGVLRPGDEFMQISPTQGEYIIEAKVNPADIGQLILGQKATIRLDAFDYSIYGAVPGRLDYLSSDTLNEAGPDGRHSQTYYRARLSLQLPDASRIRSDDIKPGLIATIDIQTGRRSVLHYIGKPIARAFSGALGQK